MFLCLLVIFKFSNYGDLYILHKRKTNKPSSTDPLVLTVVDVFASLIHPVFLFDIRRQHEGKF